jgi:putative ABC transport system permease protein
MHLWRSLVRGLRVLTHRAVADEQITDEVDHYVELAAAEHVRRGLAPDVALRAARLEVGNPTVAREAVRSYGWENAVDSVMADVRFAVRRLRHHPSFTVVAVLTLALGVGATTAIFSAIDPILLSPLPYPNGNRLITVSDGGPSGGLVPPTYGTFGELAARMHSVVSIAAVDDWGPSLSDVQDPEQLVGQFITPGYFGTLGVRPSLGRDFAADDDQLSGPRVVIVSDRLARRRFGSAQSILGRIIRLGDLDYQVIGVMPARFTNILAPAADIWTPMRRDVHAPFNSVVWGHHYGIVARLEPNATLATATIELAAIASAPMAEFARPTWANMNAGMIARSLRDDVTHDARPALLAIGGAVLLLLVIACVNVTNLLLAQRGRRRAELAMRIALGAGRGRLVRQEVTECLVLALAGGALGLIVASGGVHALIAVAPPGLPRVDAVGMNGAVFAFALAMTTLVGLIIGVASALGAQHGGNAGAGGLRDKLQHGARSVSGGGAVARRMLVVAEVALAIVLLASTGLLMRSLTRVFAIEPGFDPSRLLTMQVIESGSAYQSDTARREFFEQAIAAVRALPGVQRVAVTSQLPLSGELDGYGFEVQSRPDVTAGDAGSALRYAITPEYFKAMRIPLKRGRYLDARDRIGAPEAVVVSESFARRLFGDRDPIGERVRFGPEAGSTRAWDEIVGVVGDVKQQSLAMSQTNAFYVAMGQWSWVDREESIVVRVSESAGDAASIAPAVRRAIWSVDKTRPIQRVATMEQLIIATEAQRRFALAIIETFALAALLLAAIGLYGVVSGAVSERTREIGIRVALGATSRGIVAGIVGGAVALAAIGTALGLVGAGLASRLLETMLFGVSRLDPTTYASVALLLGGVAAIASWAPARRAARVDPAITLRAE